MADSKLSGGTLDALTGANLATGDLIYGVDISNAAGAHSDANGNSISITANELQLGLQRLGGFTLNANNLSDMANAGTARTNLGLGSIATLTSSAGGDLTGTWPSPTIAAGAVTLAKQSNAAASSFRGNNTGAPATPIDMTVAQAKTLLAIANTDVSGLGTASTHAATDFAQVANNLSDVTASTARTNLGLGSSATHAATDFAAVANNLSDMASIPTAKTNLKVGYVVRYHALHMFR